MTKCILFAPSNSTTSSKKLPFSCAERELIEALVRERPIIDDKRIHAKNIQLKKQAWQDLALAYNSQSYVSKRLPQQLKRCWENIKTQRKKERFQESMSLIRTGSKKFLSEAEVRYKRTTVNMQQDQALHDMRIEREKVLMEREKNMLEFEKEFHVLQIQKIKLEIEALQRHGIKNE